MSCLNGCGRDKSLSLIGINREGCVSKVYFYFNFWNAASLRYFVKKSKKTEGNNLWISNFILLLSNSVCSSVGRAADS